MAALFLLVACSNLHADDSVDTNKPPASQTLLIFGASYAGSWGTPALPGYRVVNRGVGGEQTKHMRARFQRDVVAADPDVVLIWGHINNITQSDILSAGPERAQALKESAREDYLAMVGQARAAGIDVMLATEIPLAEPAGLVNEARALLGRLRGKQSYSAQVNAHVRELNGFVRKLAAKEGLSLLDFELAFAPEGGPRKPEYAAEDRSHVTAAGYKALTAYAVAELGKRR
jgi:lysophospholipase L1-like esterase